MTMRQLLDILKTATEEEKKEFSEWWAELPLPEICQRGMAKMTIEEALDQQSEN